jgi:hypothetical protein
MKAYLVSEMGKNRECYSYQGTPFQLIVNAVDNGKGVWSTQDCEIWRIGGNEKNEAVAATVGTFHYGYSGGIQNIFKPFKHKGKWYCTYATSYTCLSVACLDKDQLVHVADVPGDLAADGFCPAEAGVPFRIDCEEGLYADWDLDGWDFTNPSANRMNAEFCDFGFYCGCVWGDDSSYKLKFIDFRDLEQGKIYTPEEPLDYYELPQNVSLEDAVTDMWILKEDPSFVQFSATTFKTFRRRKDKLDSTKGQWTKFD